MNAQDYLNRLIDDSDNNNIISAAGFAADKGQRAIIRSIQTGDPYLSPLEEAEILRRKFNWTEGARVSDVGRAYLNNFLLAPLLDVLDEKTQAQLEQVPIGYLTLRALNAHSFKSPEGDPIIVMNQGLPTLLSEYMEVQVEANAIREQQGPRAEHLYRQNWYRFLLEQFDNILPFDNNLVSAPYDLLETKATVKIKSSELFYVGFNLAASEMFVLAHELAHIYAGHLESSAIRSVAHDQAPLQEKRPLECYQLSWQQEFDADRLGFLHFLKAWPRCEIRPRMAQLVPPDIIAPFSFFELLHLFESNIASPDAYITHPPAIQRSRAILEMLWTLYNLEEPKTAIDTDLRDICLSFVRHMRALQEFKVYG